MASWRILVGLIALSYASIATLEAAVPEDTLGEAEGSISPLEPGIEQMRLKISSLESGVSDRTNELKRKDDIIQQLEMIVDEKSAAIESLQLEMVSFQKRGAIDAQRMLRKATTRARELEKQIDGLVNELRAQSEKREDLEARAARAEKEIREISRKVESLETRNDEQQCRLQETQHSLALLEEQLTKTQLEAKLASSKLIEVYQAWLPVWFANYFSCCPNWIPTAEQQLKIFPRQIQLHMQSSTNKLVEAYARCQAVFVSRLQEVQDFVDPYFQRAKKHLEPSINWISSIMKSHVEEAYLFFKEDGKNPLCAFNKFFNSVQAIILETLERHETSKPLATKYLVWFMATVLLLSPILLLYKFFSAAFGKNWRTRRKTRISHASRKQKSKQAIKGSRVC
ncbi:hypothetical protein Cni_G14240 [Canna indica]|uniref:Uncharacterized protein n=1 Tax=Canna indica TaxID=4628 RepID=A0AAQ3QAH6_9LILI|nr:hypothetical protein Cni_G14240 [Canna indica]